MSTLPAALSLELADEELAFFRMTCDLFPTAESPLADVDDAEMHPDDVERLFGELSERKLLAANGAGASPEVLDRLTPVSECHARVVVRFGGDARQTRDFYLSAGTGVEYRRDENSHAFGDPRSESALAVELAQLFRTRSDVKTQKLAMTAAEYLVFAVFARDVRARPTAKAADAPMSIDEVLSYFDEPENKYLRTPSDDSWQQAVDALGMRGILVRAASGWELASTLHDLAREITADHQHTVTRFDFLDEQWLVREVSLYPTRETVYRLGTQPDGSVVIQELSNSALADVLAGVVTTLPNLLSSEVQPMLKETSTSGR
jgi:hypothetical protein